MGNYNRSRSSFPSRGRSSFGRGGDRQMFKTICSNCGKDCEVPFRPTGAKPVYCSDCFERMGGRRSGSPRPERSGFRQPNSGFDQNKSQLEAIISKLDKIIALLEPKTVVPAIPSPVNEEVKEADVKKPKKAGKKSTPKKKKLKEIKELQNFNPSA